MRNSYKLFGITVINF